MVNLPKKCLIDTNVPKTANLASNPIDIPDPMTDCVRACVEAVEHVVKRGALVIDSGDEILDEYRRQLSMSGQPGVGDKFMKWVHDNQCNPQKVDRVTITKSGTSYVEFPKPKELSDFDRSDRKFVAVANTHPEKPPILQATDSKWWGWNDALKKVDIEVLFLCPQYIKQKYEEKMGT